METEAQSDLFALHATDLTISREYPESGKGHRELWTIDKGQFGAFPDEIEVLRTVHDKDGWELRARNVPWRQTPMEVRGEFRLVFRTISDTGVPAR